MARKKTKRKLPKRKPPKKKPPKKKPPKNKAAVAEIALLKKALTKLPKAELVERLLKNARLDNELRLEWLKEFNITFQTSTLFDHTAQTIDIATEVDEDHLGHDFDYSYTAYVTVKRNFKALVKDARWNEVCDLALILMKQGSQQAESSAQGLMVDDIEDCLNEILDKIDKSTLSPAQIKKWAAKMLKHDRIACISRAELEELCSQ